MNKNYTHTVIQSVAKNLGNTRLMYPRSFTPFRMTMLAAAMALSFSACQNEEPLDAPVAKDALALMPAETPVGIQAQLKGGFAQGESRTGTSTTATNWYAWCEIHPTNQLVGIELTVPGASDPDKTSLSANDVSLESLQTTEPFSTLKLKDFNLTEGGDRCVSRWTELSASCFSSDHLIGFARLEADAQGNPVLDFGELKRTVTKVTLVLKDENGDPIRLDDGSKVSAEISYQQSYIASIYTPEGETQAIGFSDYLKGIKTLQADEAIDPERFGWAVYAAGRNFTFPLEAMVNADESASYYGEQDNMRALLVRPTPTHKKNDDGTFTLLEGGPQLTDADKLTIQVKKDPDDNGPLTTGTYTLKLKDVKLADGTNLTALKSGEHLTLTVTLQHNMLVQATATIGGWDEVSADVDLNDDAAKIPYEYKEADNTYIIYTQDGIVPCLEHKEANHINATVWYKGMTIDIPLAQLAVVSGAETDLAAAIGDKTTIIFTGTETDAIKSFINSKTGAFTLLLPNITTIGEQAFYSCFSLASISLPSATSVGQAAFFGCTSLVSVSLPAATTVENETFFGCASLASVSLPQATTIRKDAFYGCTSLVSVSLPVTTNIGENAFLGCTSLAGVSLPSATNIGNYAFYGCTSLTTLTFGSVITEVGYNAFYNVGNGAGNCALTLASEQQHMTNASASSPGTPNGTPVTSADADALETERTWGGYTWKSITISNNQ